MPTSTETTITWTSDVDAGLPPSGYGTPPHSVEESFTPPGEARPDRWAVVKIRTTNPDNGRIAEYTRYVHKEVIDKFLVDYGLLLPDEAPP